MSKIPGRSGTGNDEQISESELSRMKMLAELPGRMQCSAMMFLAKYYATSGEGRAVRDPWEAKKWLDRASATGNTTAQVIAGRMYELGVLGEQNYIKAAEWYKRAAEKHYPAAMVALAKMYSMGYGVLPGHSEKAQETARELFTNALRSLSKPEKAKVMCCLAQMYIKGIGGTKRYW